MSKVVWSIREDGDDYVIITQFTGDSGETSPWRDVARMTAKYLAEHTAERIVEAMNEREAPNNT